MAGSHSTQIASPAPPRLKVPLDNRNKSAIFKYVDVNAAPDQPPSTPDSVPLVAVRCGAPFSRLSFSVPILPLPAQAPSVLTVRRCLSYGLAL